MKLCINYVKMLIDKLINMDYEYSVYSIWLG